MKHYDGIEDARYDDWVVSIMDDEDEAREENTRRDAAQASLQDAFAEGVRAGHMGLSAALNPYQDEHPEHHEWNRGRLSTLGMARRVA